MTISILFDDRSLDEFGPASAGQGLADVCQTEIDNSLAGLLEQIVRSANYQLEVLRRARWLPRSARRSRGRRKEKTAPETRRETI